MTRLMSRFPLFGLIALLALASGCATEPPSYVVSGKVNLDGKPLKDGEISFVAEDGKTPLANGSIVAGAFEFPAQAGKKKVQIYSRHEVPGSGMFNELLPAKYNSATELTAEVKAGGENKFTFELKSR
jgi:hypothetical protein